MRDDNALRLLGDAGNPAMRWLTRYRLESEGGLFSDSELILRPSDSCARLIAEGATH